MIDHDAIASRRVNEVAQRIADLINRSHELEEMKQYKERRFLEGIGVVLRTPKRSPMENLEDRQPTKPS